VLLGMPPASAYDYLILATGVEQSYFGHPEFEAFAPGLKSLADAVAIRPMANLCMSWDHRALDGALAARFLSAVKRNVESWRGG